MKSEPKYSTEQQFQEAIDSLSFNTIKVLHAIQVRDGIVDRDEFRHVVNMTGETLDETLAELIKLGLIEMGHGT